MMTDWGYEWIKSLAQEESRRRGQRVDIRRDLLALSDHQDPFFVGQRCQIPWAKWFKEMWEQEYHGAAGIHIRRCHYRLQSFGTFPKPDGMPYRNVERDWENLQQASQFARQLRWVDPAAFVDRRNPVPHPLNWTRTIHREPAVELPALDWYLPELNINFGSVDWSLETPDVEGYADDDFLDRAYHLELWVEKSTANDILVPLCEEHGIQFVPSIGFQSITSTIRLLERIREIGKPTRIFYISDADKAGRGMPISVSRQIEFWRRDFVPDIDIKVMVLALTQEQIDSYNLPVNEDGSAELDALEALHPGELKRIVEQAIEPYLDASIPRQLRDAAAEAQEIVEEERTERTTGHQKRLAAIVKQVRAVTVSYQKEAKLLNKRLQRDLAPFRKPLAQLKAELDECAEKFRESIQSDLPERPAQVASDVDESAYLFDSTRSYLEQLAFYKRQRGCDEKNVALAHE
ncbi:MAG: hypothetical protein WBQ89_26135 [Candidatus Acidiferrum sp.]